MTLLLHTQESRGARRLSDLPKAAGSNGGSRGSAVRTTQQRQRKSETRGSWAQGGSRGRFRGAGLAQGAEPANLELEVLFGPHLGPGGNLKRERKPKFSSLPLDTYPTCAPCATGRCRPGKG